METPPPEFNRRTTRSALQEIPDRLSALSMNDMNRFLGLNNNTENMQHQTRLNGGENVQNRLNGDLVIVASVPSSYVTPSPSPDELIIQQRGRRRTINWSPDIDSGKRQLHRIFSDSTPVKSSSSTILSPGKTTMQLRSTPRKRLLLLDQCELSPSPRKMPKYSPSNSKKLKSETKQLAILYGPLDCALKAMTKDQLIEIIKGVIVKHPNVEEVVKKYKKVLTSPTFRPLYLAFFLALY